MADEENIQNSDFLNELYFPKVQGGMILEKAMQVMPIPQALQDSKTTIESSNLNQTSANTTDGGSNQTSETSKDPGK